eukprot:GCRY01003979.1.p1 GENE.GCRY01003979.1~~GCRY01003979.1.p1  ORF type:complete len:207 (+),score=45.13 GCRY01003979.1:135-755(+)
MNEEIVHQGILKKQGKKNKNWKTRFFLLKESVLEYYEPGKEKDARLQPLGTIYLKDIDGIARTKAESAGKVKFMFTLATRYRDYILEAESEEQLVKWMRVLSEPLSVTPPKIPSIDSPFATNYKFSALTDELTPSIIGAVQEGETACPYSEYGCEEVGPVEIMIRHHKHCPFRIVHRYSEQIVVPLQRQVDELTKKVDELTLRLAK